MIYPLSHGIFSSLLQQALHLSLHFYFQGYGGLPFLPVPIDDILHLLDSCFYVRIFVDSPLQVIQTL
jgi:hypothetical protein